MSIQNLVKEIKDNHKKFRNGYVTSFSIKDFDWLYDGLIERAKELIGSDNETMKKAYETIDNTRVEIHEGSLYDSNLRGNVLTLYLHKSFLDKLGLIKTEVDFDKMVDNIDDISQLAALQYKYPKYDNDSCEKIKNVINSNMAIRGVVLHESFHGLQKIVDNEEYQKMLEHHKSNQYTMSEHISNPLEIGANYEAVKHLIAQGVTWQQLYRQIVDMELDRTLASMKSAASQPELYDEPDDREEHKQWERLMKIVHTKAMQNVKSKYGVYLQHLKDMFENVDSWKDKASQKGVWANSINGLIRIADKLDEYGLYKEADKIDSYLKGVEI